MITALLLLIGANAIAADPIVSVTLADGHSFDVDDKSWAALPAETVKATEKDGSEHSYTGVRLDALLASHGVPVGEALKGSAFANAVVVEGRDGYRVVFGLGEVDPATSGRSMVLARTRDGAAMNADHGPVQLIVAGDKRPARSVRQVVRIAVVTLPPTQASPAPPPSPKTAH